MNTELIEKIKEVNENPDLWFNVSKESLQSDILLMYDFEKKRAFASVDLRKIILDRLKQLRMSQSELARLIGEDQRHLNRYLHGGTLSDEKKERVLGTLELIKPIELDKTN